MFGEKLAEARTNKSLTQEQLAEKLYVTRQAVSRWENGKTQPDIQTLGRICSVLEVDPSYFIEVDKAEENYDGLTRWRKTELYYTFAKENKKIDIIFRIFSFLLFLSCSATSFVSTLTVVDCLTHTFGISFSIWISIIVAIFVFLSLNVYIVVRCRWMLSKLFNEWLAERGVVRTKKFI